MLDATLSRIDNEMEQNLKRLFDFLKIKSISTDPNFKKDCAEAADWLVQDLRSFGVMAQKYETGGHPIVQGCLGPNTGLHVLFYGHYDVQPVDPLELWDRNPFEPVIEELSSGPVIRGRGSSDDKGQLMTFVEACRAWVAQNGVLPFKVTFFFEGEEESGSPSLIPFMKKHKNEISSDIVLICDTGLFESRVPSIVTRLRGILKEEITISGPDKDLHSGMYGGISTNPAKVLANVLSALHDKDNAVAIPNFYDGVPELTENIEDQWRSLNFNHNQFLGEVGLSAPAGELGRSPLEMLWSRPTCEINGIKSGYINEGFKTVLPSQATAKISFRLVGNQDPVKIRKSFRNMVQNLLPADCRVSFEEHEASKASQMDTSAPEFEIAREAISQEWKIEAAFIGCGGSIPIAGYFQQITGVDPMLIGFAKDDDQIHSPNEKYDLESFQKGIRAWVRVINSFAGLQNV
jgi:acetylornithine deacetylase/succinyl-diaminopimelate desuccinylase-like protein